jgi:hypothetical protein
MLIMPVCTHEPTTVTNVTCSRQTCFTATHPAAHVQEYSAQSFEAEAHVNNKNSVRTAKKTQHFTTAKINWLTLFKEIINVYSDNHTKPINAK